LCGALGWVVWFPFPPTSCPLQFTTERRRRLRVEALLALALASTNVARVGGAAVAGVTGLISG